MIIERQKLNLTESQSKLIKSGWGKDAVEKVTTEKISYKSDGLKVNGYIAYPKASSKKYPCIIWCRGGFGNAGALDDFNAQGILGQIASWGYVVLESQYRGNAGGEGTDEFGGADLNDVLNLIPLADEIENANTELWGIEGWSRGGMMTYLTLTKSAIFKAAIVTGGITNLNCNVDESTFIKRLFESSLGNSDSINFEEKCKTRSIINFADRLSKNTPLLILHGTADSRVPPHNSIDLSYRLLEYKLLFRLVMLENGDHFLKSHKKEVDVLRKFWFEKYLK
ncbi:prolyl oligopeptidase family protein [bacterium BMS3Abin04]|nr:prolyl oligopeptidase family protein [bacterium BMS3Abin04]